jgi:hypothetical protein
MANIDTNTVRANPMTETEEARCNSASDIKDSAEAELDALTLGLQRLLDGLKQWFGL